MDTVLKGAVSILIKACPVIWFKQTCVQREHTDLHYGRKIFKNRFLVSAEQEIWRSYDGI